MAKLIKRSQIRAFLNTSPATPGSPVWGIVGNKQTTGDFNYDANTTDETYIVDDNATVTIDSYKLTLPNEMKCYFGDGVYDFVNTLRRNLATGTDAETQVLLIDTYDEQGGSFFAQKYNCSISVEKYGGDGGETPTISFTINANGNPVNGTATITQGVPTFTESASL